jgi:hypothetical protein
MTGWKTQFFKNAVIAAVTKLPPTKATSNCAQPGSIILLMISLSP